MFCQFPYSPNFSPTFFCNSLCGVSVIWFSQQQHLVYWGLVLHSSAAGVTGRVWQRRDEAATRPPRALTPGTAQSQSQTSLNTGAVAAPVFRSCSLCSLGTAQNLCVFLWILSLVDGVAFPAGRNKLQADPFHNVYFNLLPRNGHSFT